VKPFHERSDLINFGLELTMNIQIFGVRFVALRFGHHIIGIEWGYER